MENINLSTAHRTQHAHTNGNGQPSTSIQQDDARLSCERAGHRHTSGCFAFIVDVFRRIQLEQLSPMVVYFLRPREKNVEKSNESDKAGGCGGGHCDAVWWRTMNIEHKR